MARPGKPARKKGGQHARRKKPAKPARRGNRFKKPKNTSMVRRRELTPKELANLKPWKPGQSGNPSGGSKTRRAVLEVHKAFNQLLQVDAGAGAPVIVEVFAKLRTLILKRNSVQAARTLLDWGIGSPAQTVKIMPAVDINIGLAPEIEQPDVASADNVTIERGEEAGSGSWKRR